LAAGMSEASGPSRARYPLVVFDLDGTLVRGTQSIWRRLHGAMGSDPARRDAVVADGLAGRISYERWFAEDCAMLREAGATREAILAFLAAFEETPGATALIRDLRDGGARVAVMSGGIDLVRRVVFGDLAFDAVFANRLNFDAGGRVDGGTATPFDMVGKAAGLEHLAGLFGLDLAEVAFVGDGDNDVYGARVAGLSVAWGDAAPALVQVADAHVEAASMDALRPLLFQP